MTHTAIIVDSACSLPKKIRDKYHVSYAPLQISVDGKSYTDPCDEHKASDQFARGVFGRKHKVSTTPPSSGEFENAIQQKIKEGYDRIIVQTVNRTQGDTYNNANAAVAHINSSLNDKSIVVRVMDSRTVFAGQGLMAAETIRRMLREKSHDEARRKMDVLSEKIHTFILPKEPLVAQERSTTRNENSVSWSQALVANTLGIHPIICNVNDSSNSSKTIWGFKKAAQALFDHACKRMEVGLFSPFITVNYAGPLTELKALPGFDKMQALAEEKKLKLIPSVASLACGIYTSPGSISLALATEEHTWE